LKHVREVSLFARKIDEEADALNIPTKDKRSKKDRGNKNEEKQIEAALPEPESPPVVMNTGGAMNTNTARKEEVVLDEQASSSQQRGVENSIE
jgi:hypothetical protein